MRSRVVPAAAVALVALLATPLLVGARYDSFPLSTYPMFASDRARVTSVSTVVVVTDDGHALRLSPPLIGGSSEPMLAAETVVRAIRRGQADELCAEVAGRAAARHPASSTFEVVTERYDAIAWFDGERDPTDRIVHASCEVPG